MSREMIEDELPPEYLRGIELFNAGRYFDSHEALEELWLGAAGVRRDLLHAIIQAAVALHHYERGNYKGAASVYSRARRRLESLPPRVMNLDTAAFARGLDEFFSAALGADEIRPLPPRIELEEKG